MRGPRTGPCYVCGEPTIENPDPAGWPADVHEDEHVDLEADHDAILRPLRATYGEPRLLLGRPVPGHPPHLRVEPGDRTRRQRGNPMNSLNYSDKREGRSKTLAVVMVAYLVLIIYALVAATNTLN
jgi:hypothetical protein